MIGKLKEILGLISGYKENYDRLVKEQQEAEAIVDEILSKLKDAYGTASPEVK